MGSSCIALRFYASVHLLQMLQSNALDHVITTLLGCQMYYKLLVRLNVQGEGTVVHNFIPHGANPHKCFVWQ